MMVRSLQMKHFSAFATNEELKSGVCVCVCVCENDQDTSSDLYCCCILVAKPTYQECFVFKLLIR